jgi:hypothetical protein
LKEWSEESGPPHLATVPLGMELQYQWRQTKDALVLLLEVTIAMGALDFISSGDGRWRGNGIGFGFCFGNW